MKLTIKTDKQAVQEAFFLKANSDRVHELLKTAIKLWIYKMGYDGWEASGETLKLGIKLRELLARGEVTIELEDDER